MKKWFGNDILYLTGIVIVAIAGYLYWQQTGCSSGTCAITSMGVLLFGLFKKEKPKQAANGE